MEFGDGLNVPTMLLLLSKAWIKNPLNCTPFLPVKYKVTLFPWLTLSKNRNFDDKPGADIMIEKFVDIYKIWISVVSILPELNVTEIGEGLVCTEFPCPGFIDLQAELGAPLDHASTVYWIQIYKIKTIRAKYMVLWVSIDSLIVALFG